MRAGFFAILLSVLLTLALSCNTSGCLDNQSAIPLAGFYSSGSGRGISIGSVMQIHGVGAPGDSLLSASSASASSIYLPMRSAYSSVSWCLHYTQSDLADPAFNDTVTFEYTSHPYFASQECGAMYIYKIERVKHTTHLVDSVVVVDSTITNTDIERLRFYFRTAETDENPPEE